MSACCCGSIAGLETVVRSSSRPGKRRVMAVIALAHQMQVEAEAVDMCLFRPGERQPAVGGMGCVVEVDRLAASIARSNPLDFQVHSRYERRLLSAVIANGRTWACC